MTLQKTFLLLVLAAVGGITLFGYFAAHPVAGGEPHEGCFASIAAGVPCPGFRDTIRMALFHLSVFKNFSLAVVPASALLTISVWLTAFLAVLVWSGRKNLGFILSGERDSKRLFGKRLISPQERQILRWLSIRENSPNSF